MIDTIAPPSRQDDLGEVGTAGLTLVKWVGYRTRWGGGSLSVRPNVGRTDPTATSLGWHNKSDLMDANLGPDSTIGFGGWWIKAKAGGRMVGPLTRCANDLIVDAPAPVMTVVVSVMRQQERDCRRHWFRTYWQVVREDVRFIFGGIDVAGNDTQAVPIGEIRQVVGQRPGKGPDAFAVEHGESGVAHATTFRPVFQPGLQDGRDAVLFPGGKDDQVGIRRILEGQDRIGERVEIIHAPGFDMPLGFLRPAGRTTKHGVGLQGEVALVVNDERIHGFLVSSVVPMNVTGIETDCFCFRYFQGEPSTAYWAGTIGTSPDGSRRFA